MKEINCYTNDESLTIVNTINKNFDMHRRLILTIVIKIDERKKNKNLIVDNATKKNYCC